MVKSSTSEAPADDTGKLTNFTDSCEIAHEAPLHMPDHIQEEIDTLAAIYEDALCVKTTHPPAVRLVLGGEAAASAGWVLDIVLSNSYPDTVPALTVSGRLGKTAAAADVSAQLQEQAGDMVGAPMLLALCSFADSWASDNPSPGPLLPIQAPEIHKRRSLLDDPEETPEARTDCVRQAYQELWSAGVPAGDTGGRDRAWKYTIGLVGKPSAGKSTLFNALTQAVGEGEGAKVAAYPFTTIDPNVGQGYAAIPCPCASHVDGLVTCGAQFGHTADKQRLVPITMKDVAGLVPGVDAL